MANICHVCDFFYDDDEHDSEPLPLLTKKQILDELNTELQKNGIFREIIEEAEHFKHEEIAD